MLKAIKKLLSLRYKRRSITDIFCRDIIDIIVQYISPGSYRSFLLLSRETSASMVDYIADHINTTKEHKLFTIIDNMLVYYRTDPYDFSDIPGSVVINNLHRMHIYNFYSMPGSGNLIVMINKSKNPIFIYHDHAISSKKYKPIRVIPSTSFHDGTTDDIYKDLLGTVNAMTSKNMSKKIIKYKWLRYHVTVYIDYL